MIASSGALLADVGIFGLVWLDGDLMVTDRYGRLCDFIALGCPIGQSLLPLYGLDEQIRATSQPEGRPLQLPAVTIRQAGAPQHRLDLTVIWSARQRRYLVLVARATAGAELEQHLAQQMRARLMAEADATALARQLARANRDLEEFASIISHDLRAPMRAMRYLTEDAEASLAGGDTAVIAGKLARVREQSLRLNTMLAALFEYSRAGYKQDVVSIVDTRALVESVVRSLPQQTSLRIDIGGDWPVIDTVAAPLDLVVRNLIDNAIKHHDRSEIRIGVVAEWSGEWLEFAVSDDGPGIAIEHHAAILMPFRRLSRLESSASSGMGLALVKRTIEAVGGRLEIHSDPRQRRGATFRVAWPRVGPD